MRRCLFADGLHLRLVEAHDRDHAAGLFVGGLGHDAAALLDQEQSSLPRDGAGRRQRRDLAQAVAGSHAHVLEAVALAPYLVGSPAHSHHAGLDDLCAVELLERAFEAKPAHGHLQDLFRTLEHAASGRVAVVQVAAHAGLLHALAGEQQRDRAGEADQPVIPRSSTTPPRSAPSRSRPAGHGLHS